jgi:hypothetical protein
MDTEILKVKVRDKYGRAARGVRTAAAAAADAMTRLPRISMARPTRPPPAEAIGASLGLGTYALAELKPGQTVLDLGSGWHRLFSARRVVWAAGFGLDMTMTCLRSRRRTSARAV